MSSIAVLRLRSSAYHGRDIECGEQRDQPIGRRDAYDDEDGNERDTDAREGLLNDSLLRWTHYIRSRAQGNKGVA